jgi:hypothetical protein
VGELSLATLGVSTRAIESNAVGDTTYANLENQLSSLNTTRNSVAGQMETMLENAEFHGQAIDEQTARKLIDQGQGLLDQASSM